MSKFKTNYSSISLVIVLSWVVLVSERKTTATRVVVAPAPAPSTGNDSSIDSIWHTKHVNILNDISEKTSFGVSCKSGDDDLGYHEVQPGDSYVFQFKPSIFHTTLYFCTFKYRNYDISFDIYRYDRDFDRCDHNCNWHVRMDAVVGFMEAVNYPDITLPWDRHPEL